MTQYLRKLHGSRSVVAAMLLAALLIVSGCGGGGSTTSSSSVTPTPTFTPPAGSYPSAQNVTVSDTNQSAVLYCTNDGSKPTTSSPKCANPIMVSQSQTINAIAVASGMSASGMATAAYTIAGSVAAPTVTGIGPATGPTAGGTVVTIVGTNFTGATAVNFGTVPATSFVVNSAGNITATSPAEGTGTVNITVVTPGGTSATSNADLYTYAASPTPVISSITPGSAPAGSTVAIIGTNFGSSQGGSTVTFNGVAATSISSWTSTSILVAVPTGATTGNVVITVGGAASAGTAFIVTLPAPIITQLSSSSGPVGSTVVIIGSNFGATQGTSTVTFNGTVATSIASWSPTTIVATVPAGATTGSVNVNVNGVESNGESFTVASTGAPVISSLSVSSGSIGTAVTITGSGFGAAQGSSTVAFNGTAATATSWTDTSIATTVPTGATTGDVVVTVNGAASNGESFTVNVPVPISGVVVSGPASGGTPLTATVQLYAAGTSGYGMGATPIGSPVQTNATTGAFTGIIVDCSTLPAPGDQLYLESVGSNTQATFMAALGSCGLLSSAGVSVTMNEVTTIASAYALSGFASINSSGGITIGTPTSATSCNATAGWKSTGPSTCNYLGLSNAFATVNNLVNVTTGTALAVTPAYASNNVPVFNNSIAPQARVNSLANALASCANPGTDNCSGLFMDATLNSVAPADTLQAAFNIAQSPANNASSIATLSASGTAYTPALTSSDLSIITDWSLPIIYQAGGLGGQSAQLAAGGIAIDGSGNVWVPLQNPAGSTAAGGAVAVFNNQGAPLSPSGSSSSGPGGFTANGTIHNPQSIAIDQNGFAWLGNAPTQTGFFAQGSVSVIDAGGNSQFGTGTVPYTNTLLLFPFPSGIAVDANNNVWISSDTEPTGQYGPCSTTDGGSVLELTASGGSINSTNAVDTFMDNSSCPSQIAIDGNGYLWTYDDAFPYNPTNDDPYINYALVLFNTSDGSLAGGPYNNWVPEGFNGNILINAANNGMFSFPTGQNQVWLQPTIAGATDPSLYNSSGPQKVSGLPFMPTMFATPILTTNPGLGQSVQSALDGAGTFWGLGSDSNGLAYFGLFAVNSADTAVVSPANGYLGYSLLSVDTVTPIYNGVASAVDSSGNVWVPGQNVTPSGSGSGNQLTEIVGVAVPVSTPLANGVAANTLAQKP
ncbi:IPT/TIG domain-containing protein [Silvibacterium acidisoli]|uniref:IPT/TIG domain-containing protein n=1 Tax=Acidobacteriaceae bacterium ZG23-2 TaxID=2883246 RepID=UPI00406D4C67